MSEALQVFFALLFLGFLLLLVGRLLIAPFRWMSRLLYSTLLGLVLLWVFNLVGGLLAFTIPLNLVTVVVAGFLGLPGLILLIILRLLVGS